MPNPSIPSGNGYLRSARLSSLNPIVGCVDDFIPPDKINLIRADLAGVALADAQIVGVDGPVVSEVRNASNYKIPRNSLHSVDVITAQVADLFQLKAQNCEYPEYIAYNEGGEFRRHFDAALNGSMTPKDAKNDVPSQRVFTAILYLNDDFSGGMTSFPRLNVELQPKAGRLAFWQNTKTGGAGVHPYSMHEGQPVISGFKQIISFWFRDRPWDPPVDECVK